jgi:hypothetical protein
MKRPALFRTFAVAVTLLSTFAAEGCAGGRPRIRLHGWPDDVDLAEILETIVDHPKDAKSHAPALVWTKNGKTTAVDDPAGALHSFRPHIKDALVPPRDATRRPLRCDVTRYRCIDDHGDERTTFWFALKGAEGGRYIVLERMETSPRPR